MKLIITLLLACIAITTRGQSLKKGYYLVQYNRLENNVKSNDYVFHAAFVLSKNKSDSTIYLASRSTIIAAAIKKSKKYSRLSAKNISLGAINERTDLPRDTGYAPFFPPYIDEPVVYRSRSDTGNKYCYFIYEIDIKKSARFKTTIADDENKTIERIIILKGKITEGNVPEGYERIFLSRIYFFG